jgi:hypothetical protein
VEKPIEHCRLQLLIEFVGRTSGNMFEMGHVVAFLRAAIVD